MTLFPIDWSLTHWRWLHEQARDRGGVKGREGEAGCLPPSSWREWGKWSATSTLLDSSLYLPLLYPAAFSFHFSLVSFLSRSYCQWPQALDRAKTFLWERPGMYFVYKSRLNTPPHTVFWAGAHRPLRRRSASDRPQTQTSHTPPSSPAREANTDPS